jgi:hypothetical protein
MPVATRSGATPAATRKYELRFTKYHFCEVGRTLETAHFVNPAVIRTS